jgi:glucokinase
MEHYEDDERIVLTLDAGGTNFVFSAIQANKEIVSPITHPSHAHDLQLCLRTIADGFAQVRDSVEKDPVAISFAFPGPADYPKGIIGDLGNLPAFRGGIALGPFLEEKFNLPVFINNDGNLFAYGEAIAGLLPEVNWSLKDYGSMKQFYNLFGITLGTGFGGGIVVDGDLIIGDNSAAGEIWLLRNKIGKNLNAEEGASIRAVKQSYAAIAGVPLESVPEPKQLFQIAKGEVDGDKSAAREAFSIMGEVVGDALANGITLIDGIIVIGGGLAGAAELFMSRIVEELNSHFDQTNGGSNRRLEIQAFNLDDPGEYKAFIRGEERTIRVPGTTKTIAYDPLQRVGVGTSRLGTNMAVSVGAYAFALHFLDKQLKEKGQLK